MAKVTANKFWEEYKLQIMKLRPSKADYKNRPRWTEITCDAATANLDRLATNSAKASYAPPAAAPSPTAKWQKEYLRVDVIGYDRIGTHDWLLRVAFEHENSDQWTDELCKLCHVVADLRVLASYYDFDQPEKIEDRLQREVNTMGNRITRVPDVEWLFIFGPWIRIAPRLRRSSTSRSMAPKSCRCSIRLRLSTLSTGHE